MVAMVTSVHQIMRHSLGDMFSLLKCNLNESTRLEDHFKRGLNQGDRTVLQCDVNFHTWSAHSINIRQDTLCNRENQSESRRAVVPLSSFTLASLPSRHLPHCPLCSFYWQKVNSLSFDWLLHLNKNAKQNRSLNLYDILENNVNKFLIWISTIFSVNIFSKNI